MKRMLIVALAFMLSASAGAAQDLSDVFNRAVHLQDVKGDLEAATSPRRPTWWAWPKTSRPV